MLIYCYFAKLLELKNKVKESSKLKITTKNTNINFFISNTQAQKLRQDT